MSLTQLVAQEKWQEFDDAWSELMLAEGPVDDLLAALRVVADKKRLPRTIAFVRQHADMLGASGRPIEAARLLGIALSGGGPPGELMAPLFEHAKVAWGSQPWWEKYTEISGLRPDNHDARKAWVSFERMMSFEVGKLVFHPGGWGTGEIVELVLDTDMLTVSFLNSRRDRFPLAAALEIFEVLPEEDLRAMFFRDPSRTHKRIKEDPLAILRAIVERHHGRASTVAIKNALLQAGIEGGAWASWWRKARKLAESSEWFRVTGSVTKGEVQLLSTASDPVAESRARLSKSTHLPDLVVQVRDQLSASQGDARLQEALVSVLEEKLRQTTHPPALALSAWLIVRDARGAPPAEFLELLRAAADRPASDGAKPSALWQLFHAQPSARDQERCVVCLSDLYGETWIDEAVKHLQHAPTPMARPLIEAILAAGRTDDLVAHYRELVFRPLRAPDLFLSLAKLMESGKISGDCPPPIQRAQAFLSLATYLFVNRRGDAQMTRTQTRLSEFLTRGPEPVLRALLTHADAPALLSLQRLLQRGVDEPIDNMFTEIVMRAAPASSGGADNFWEGDRIWTTRDGLERRRGELRVLREVKIPANQDAIGRAAAMGDLSENAEWEMAIEEQRNLTSRAAQIEAELRSVELIESAILPENVVCPGTYVRYRDLSAATEHEIAILGPWDTDQAEHVVSYRAPLAAGLLGRRPGERARISLPSGPLEVQVLATRPVLDDA